MTVNSSWRTKCHECMKLWREAGWQCAVKTTRALLWFSCRIYIKHESTIEIYQLHAKYAYGLFHLKRLTNRPTDCLLPFMTNQCWKAKKIEHFGLIHSFECLYLTAGDYATNELLSKSAVFVDAFILQEKNKIEKIPPHQMLLLDSILIH